MNERKKYPYADALAVAKELHAILKPACLRLAIVGSVRRGKEFCSDLEILFIPVESQRRDGLFGMQTVNVTDEVIEKQLMLPNILSKRPNVNGHFCWGVANKLAIHNASGIPVDLFATSLPNWFVSLVIRTGSKENNLRLTMAAQRRGATLNAYGSGVTYSDGSTEAANSEEDVYMLCGIPFVEVRKR